MKKTDRGTEIARNTSMVLKEIMNGAAKSKDLISEISIASNEQAQGINQINQGLGQMEKVTLQNTSSAEETAAAALELSTQAAQLHQLMSRFKITHHDSSRVSASPDSPNKPAPPLRIEMNKNSAAKKRGLISA
ncbi:MAG: hypothetical protein HQK55_13155 [Deltaproteobacteria bacterium]|nr:hypothetical protein [Deltaproteobacteria bacterium]